MEAWGPRGKGLFTLCMKPVNTDEANVTSSSGCHADTTSYFWHLRFGHIGYSGLDTIVKKNCGAGIDLASVKQWELCDGCALGKQTRVSFMPKTPHRAKQLLKSSTVMYVDLCSQQSLVASGTLSLSPTNTRTLPQYFCCETSLKLPINLPSLLRLLKFRPARLSRHFDAITVENTRPVKWPSSVSGEISSKSSRRLILHSLME